MLRDSWLVPEVVRVLMPAEFYLEHHSKIYEAIITLCDSGTNPDLVTLAEWLIERGNLEDVGGIAYLAELHAESSSVNVKSHAEIIRNYATRRDMIFACKETMLDALDDSIRGTELLQEADKRLMAIADRTIAGEAVSMQTLVAETYERLERAKLSERVEGVPTGLHDLDRIKGGFRASEFIVIAARPSVGKTALGMQIAMNAAAHFGEPVLFVSLEQDRAELSDRLFCSRSTVDSSKFRGGKFSSSENESVVDAGEILSKLPLWIDDTPSQSMMRIAAGARRIMHRHGLRMIVVDYLQLIESDKGEERSTRQEKVSSISRRLKFLARELKIPVVAMAQLNRAVEDRTGGKPRLADLRESGAIEQDADAVILMHRSEDYGATAQIDLILAKNRNGPTGEIATMYAKQYMRFDSMEKNYARD